MKNCSPTTRRSLLRAPLARHPFTPSCLAVRPAHRKANVAATAAINDFDATPTPSTSSSLQSILPIMSRRNALGLFTAGLAAVGNLNSPLAAAAEPEMPENPATRAINAYTELENKGKFKDRKALDDFRAKNNFRRAFDGRVSVRAANGEWYAVRLDMEVPGALLLRDSSGYIYAVQTDGLQQVDLSDDFVVLLMFADRDWEQQLSPVELADEQGKPVQLKLDEKQFRDVIGILKELQEAQDDEGEEENPASSK